MTTKDIIKLGTGLGLPFDRDDNFPEMLANDTVVFNGSNGQRFLIDGRLPDKDVLRKLGNSLILYGARLKCMEFDRVMSINGDSLDIPEI